MLKAIAAPNRVLNETNAAGTSFKFQLSTQQVDELDIQKFSKAKSSNQHII
jgi:hypothetical protein